MAVMGNLKIGSRLFIGFGVIVVILISLTLYGIRSMETLSRQTIMMYNHPLTVSNTVLKINTNIIKIDRAMKDIVLAEDVDSMTEYTQTVNALEQEVFRDFEIII